MITLPPHRLTNASFPLQWINKEKIINKQQLEDVSIRTPFPPLTPARVYLLKLSAVDYLNLLKVIRSVERGEGSGKQRGWRPSRVVIPIPIIEIVHLNSFHFLLQVPGLGTLPSSSPTVIYILNKL